ncbi:MAG: hypothetical protein HY321_22395 [Armatimonadetes bacterium]|nr:hypothetical protein [Armatimonadota bacterium]
MKFAIGGHTLSSREEHRASGQRLVRAGRERAPERARTGVAQRTIGYYESLDGFRRSIRSWT